MSHVGRELPFSERVHRISHVSCGKELNPNCARIITHSSGLLKHNQGRRQRVYAGCSFSRK